MNETTRELLIVEMEFLAGKVRSMVIGEKDYQPSLERLHYIQKILKEDKELKETKVTEVIKVPSERKKLDPNVVLTSLVTIGMGLTVLYYEKADVITSKVWNSISKKM